MTRLAPSVSALADLFPAPVKLSQSFYELVKEKSRKNSGILKSIPNPITD